MRRRARECALQILFQLDAQAETAPRNFGGDLEQELERYWSSFEAVGDDVREFAERLVRGVVRGVEGLDARLEGVSSNWKLSRMARVDRNLLRLGAFEILECPDIPRSASINEAIEIAKRFGSDESPAFVNGILDKLNSE